MVGAGGEVGEGGGMPAVVFFGMQGVLSLLPLSGLLDAGVLVRAVVTPGVARAGGVRELPPPTARGRLPRALLGRTVVDLAWERGIPVLEVDALDGAAVDALRRFAPDLVVVSCFPLRFPDALLGLPPLGCLNLHPSLLPRNRGPAPLFWAFREEAPGGEVRGGATAHLMDAGLDAGPIVAQEGFAVPDGATGGELELRAAALGAELTARAARGLADGTLTPRAQDEADATTYPWPRADDFVVPTDRPARWAYNFIRGTAGWGYPHVVVADGRHYRVRAARAYEPAGDPGGPVVDAGDAGGARRLLVRCAPGVLTVEATPEG